MCSLGVLIIHSLRFIRKLSYEFFLRTHQALAFLSGYVLWRRLGPKSFIIQSLSLRLRWDLRLHIRSADLCHFILE